MELIEAAASGLRETFTAAVTAHSHAMFRAARAALDGDADAEDAVGEAVLRAWQSFGRLKDHKVVRAWLIKITVNCAHEQRRKVGRVTYVEDMTLLGGSVAPPAVTGLWDAVLRLPEDQRVVVTLFYYEEMTVEQVAQTLSLPQGTVKSRLSRARERLKTLLSEEE